MTDATIDLPEELAMLRESARRIFDRAGGLSRARSLRGSSPGFDRAVWSQMGEAGLLGAVLPENAGGLGLELSAPGIIAEEAGRALIPEPFVGAAGLTCAVLKDLKNTQASNFARDLASGKSIAVIAWQEDARNPAFQPPETSLRDGRLFGVKECVAHADGADCFIVSASGTNGMALCRVDADAPGLTISARPQTDGSSLCQVAFSDVGLSPNGVLCEGYAAEKALASAFDEATALAAGELLGVMSAAFEMTIDYLATRKQFGQPIGAFQALQHRAVDMKIQRELTEATVRATITELEQERDGAKRAALASRAKARAGSAAQLICREGIQMHGAIGYTDECNIGLYLNRALALAAWHGNSAYHRSRYAHLKTAA